MAKILKQTFKNPDVRKPCIKFTDDEEGVPMKALYLMKDALEEAGIKAKDVKSVDVQYTVHTK